MITALLVTAVLAPQQPARGLLVGAPLTLAVDDATAAHLQVSPLGVHYKPAGIRAIPPVDHPLPPSRPHFSGMAVPWHAPGVHIDAFSTNLNYIAATPGGIVSKQLVNYEWAGLAVSVTPSTVGEPGSAFAIERIAGDSTGDVYEYLFPESAVRTPVDVTVRPIDSRDISLDPTVEFEPEMIAFDVYAPGLLHPQHIANALHADFTGVVFSVTEQTAAAAPDSWFRPKGFPSGPVLKTGASLLWAEWSQQTGWSGPHLLHHPWRLGLLPGHELDALAWHKHNNEHFLLFSSDVPAQDAIMFVNLGTNDPAKPLEFNGPGGTKRVSVKMKLRPEKNGIRVDDVDALSAFDPRRDFRTLVAQPMPPGPLPGLNGSAFRDQIFDPVGGPETTEWLTCMVPQAELVAGWALIWGRLPGIAPVLLGFEEVSESTEFVQFRMPAVPSLVYAALELQWTTVENATTLEPLHESAWLRLDI